MSSTIKSNTDSAVSVPPPAARAPQPAEEPPHLRAGMACVARHSAPMRVAAVAVEGVPTGALGGNAGARPAPEGPPQAVSAAAAAPDMRITDAVGTDATPAAPADAVADALDDAQAQPAAAADEPELVLRVRAVYAVDNGATPAWTLDQIRTTVSALVDAANRDNTGMGLRYVFFPRHDVEIRSDTALRQDFPIANPVATKMVLGLIGEEEGKRLLAEAEAVSKARRNALAAERPNTMLWLFSRGNRFDVVRDASGAFVRFNLVDNRGGSFSGGDNNFVALHEVFLSSPQWAHDDASRAVHEVGHYLGLGHTHLEPYHDLEELAKKGNLPADILSRPAAERLQLWQAAAAAWLDARLPEHASTGDARTLYDADRGSGVLDTSADPGAGILALANEAAGHGADELGPVRDVTVTPARVGKPVRLIPQRNNVMSYYLRETPSLMRFSPHQRKVMRQQLDGPKRALVAAQLGDSATPDLRVCAVWSPQAAGQRLTWRQDFAFHSVEHKRMRSQGFAMASQQAYTHGAQVVYDGIWNPGTQAQEIIWGWLDEHVRADMAQRASRGMVPVSVQGYQHLNHGPRYNVIYEPGAPNNTVLLLGVTQDELASQWAAFSPLGYRLVCLSSHVDAAGVVRHSTVLRRTHAAQSWVTGWAGADIAAEYGRQWARGWKLRHLTLAKIADGHRWSGVFEPDAQGQLVYWAHVRERISEVYDEMWAQDFKLRALWVAPA